MKRGYVKIIIFLIPVVLGMGAIKCHRLYSVRHAEGRRIMLDYMPEALSDEGQLDEMVDRLWGVGPVEGYYRASGLLAELSLGAALVFSVLAITGKLSWKIVIVIFVDWIAAVFAFVTSMVRY